MKTENGLGGIVNLAGKRRNPYMIRYTKGYIINGVTGKKEQVFKVIGYATTIKEAKSLLLLIQLVNLILHISMVQIKQEKRN